MTWVLFDHIDKTFYCGDPARDWAGPDDELWQLDLEKAYKFRSEEAAQKELEDIDVLSWLRDRIFPEFILEPPTLEYDNNMTFDQKMESIERWNEEVKAYRIECEMRRPLLKFDAARTGRFSSKAPNLANIRPPTSSLSIVRRGKQLTENQHHQDSVLDEFANTLMQRWGKNQKGP